MPFSTIEEIAAALGAGEITAHALVERHIARIEALNPQLDAYVRHFGEAALQIASARDIERRAGRPVGPLHGIPLAAKDLFHYAGYPTEAGSRMLRNVASSVTAHSIRRLEAAGMVVLGKTQTVEFAFGGWGTNPSVGTPRNPWDRGRHRIPGGSSSGSAVAVAAGLAPAALGSDTGGSIRIPAGLCGVVGLKTSLGLVGRSGVLPLCPTHDTVGPLARSVRDVALLMQALTGPDLDDPSTTSAPQLDFLAEIERGVDGLRIAALDTRDLIDLDPQIRALFERGLKAIEDLGAQVSWLRLPRPLEEYMQLAGRLMSAESYRHLAPFADRDDSLVHPVIRERILRGSRISAADYMALLEARHQAQQEMLRCLDRIDAVVAPTCPIPAIPVDEVNEDKTPLSAYGRFVNFLDLASLSIPVGTVPDGLPAGLQIIVRRFDDPLALRIGRALERDAGCAFRVPAGLIDACTSLTACGSRSQALTSPC